MRKVERVLAEFKSDSGCATFPKFLGDMNEQLVSVVNLLEWQAAPEHPPGPFSPSRFNQAIEGALTGGKTHLTQITRDLQAVQEQVTGSRAPEKLSDLWSSLWEECYKAFGIVDIDSPSAYQPLPGLGFDNTLLPAADKLRGRGYHMQACDMVSMQLDCLRNVIESLEWFTGTFDREDTSPFSQPVIAGTQALDRGNGKRQPVEVLEGPRKRARGHMSNGMEDGRLE